MAWCYSQQSDLVVFRWTTHDILQDTDQEFQIRIDLDGSNEWLQSEYVLVGNQDGNVLYSMDPDLWSEVATANPSDYSSGTSEVRLGFDRVDIGSPSQIWVVGTLFCSDVGSADFVPDLSSGTTNWAQISF